MLRTGIALAHRDTENSCWSKQTVGLVPAVQSRRRSGPILSPHSTSVQQRWVNDIFSTVGRRVTPWVLGGYQPSGILWVTFIRPEAGPDLRIETLLASSSHSFSRCWLFYFNLCAIWWLVKNMQLKSLNPHIGCIQSPSPCRWANL